MISESLSAKLGSIEIDPSYADTAEFCQQYGYSLDVCGNTIMVVSKRAQAILGLCGSGLRPFGCEQEGQVLDGCVPAVLCIG